MLILIALLTYLFGLSTKMQTNGLSAHVPDSAPTPEASSEGHAPLGPLEIVGSGPVALIPKGHYLAKIQLTGIQSLFGTAGAVKAKLAELGFSPVSVWSASPPALFPDAAPEVEGSTYWAAGTYSAAFQNAKRPAQIKRLWVLPLAESVPVATAGTRESRLTALQGKAYEIRRAIEALLEEDE